MVRRSKPFKYTYEKEIVMYAYFKKLDYFSTECIYSPNAYRGYARTFLKDLEAVRPSAIIGMYSSFQADMEKAMREGHFTNLLLLNCTDQILYTRVKLLKSKLVSRCQSSRHALAVVISHPMSFARHVYYLMA